MQVQTVDSEMNKLATRGAVAMYSCPSDQCLSCDEPRPLAFLFASSDAPANRLGDSGAGAILIELRKCARFFGAYRFWNSTATCRLQIICWGQSIP